MATVVSEKNVGKIHVFQSETQYTNNLEKVSTNDLAMVKVNLFDQLKGNTTPVLVPLCDWDKMKTLVGSANDIRTGYNSTTGIRCCTTDKDFPLFTVSGASLRGIVLKESIKNYDALIFQCSDDSASYISNRFITLHEFLHEMSIGGYFNLNSGYGNGLYWIIYPFESSGTLAYKSTDTIFYIQLENSCFIEIYGVKYMD